MVNKRRSTFTINSSHIKLLREACWSWNYGEHGAPSMDCKRPYGNSDVLLDIIQIVDVEDMGDNKPTKLRTCPHCGESIPQYDEAYYHKLHDEMQIVLEILAHNATTGIQAGDTFVRSDGDRIWGTVLRDEINQPCK